MRRLGSVVMLLVLLAGCSSTASTSSSTAGSRPTTSPSTPVSAPAPSPPSLAQLEPIVLHSTDLPAGWTGTPYEADPSSAAASAEMAACVGVPDSATDKSFEANSDSFALGALTISSSASSYTSQSDIDTDTALLNGPKVVPCYEQMVRKVLARSLPAKGTINSVSFKVTPGPAGGPANVVATLTGTATVSANGQKIVLYPTMVFIAGPLVEAEVDAMGIGTPVPADTMSALVAAVATRAAVATSSATV